MAEEFANKIKRLELENFTCFGKVAMDFSPGINVFIGENGTGKTHLLKVLYGLRGGGFSYPANIEDEVELSTTRGYEQVFEEIFKVGDFKRLVRTNNQPSQTKVYAKRFLDFEEWFSKYASFNIKDPYLYVPSYELLSWFKGFISSYENRESYIDELYYKLAKAIDPLSLKGEALERQKPLLKDLEEAIRAKVIRKGDDFFLSFIDENKEYPAQTVATGINKLAQLIYLIMNGSLTKDTILFWDEPEANLNPKYITVVSKFLQTLANAGCQIFVATHDYLLLSQLSMAKQFKEMENNVPDMKFFSLKKGEDGTEIEEGGLISEIQNNPILDEYARLQETKLGLYAKQLETT